jgi:acetyl-CoA carboxylase biotin carboxyl carrier protein
MDYDKIRELVRLVEESGITELELSNRGETIRIAKGTAGVAASPGMSAPPPPMTPAAPVSPAAPTEAPPSPSRIATAEGLREIASPMVGTFYRSPSPEADPFVRVGDRVAKGDVICILEAMKMMNEIESEYDGVIREILIENAQPVEYGQPLFLITEAG